MPIIIIIICRLLFYSHNHNFYSDCGWQQLNNNIEFIFEYRIHASIHYSVRSLHTQRKHTYIPTQTDKHTMWIIAIHLHHPLNTSINICMSYYVCVFIIIMLRTILYHQITLTSFAKSIGIHFSKDNDNRLFNWWPNGIDRKCVLSARHTHTHTHTHTITIGIKAVFSWMVEEKQIHLMSDKIST